MKGFGILYKNLAIIKKKNNFRPNFRKKTYVLTTSISGRITFCISDEKDWCRLQKNLMLFGKKIIFEYISPNILTELLFFLTATSFALLAVDWCFAYQVKGIEVLYKKIVISEKNIWLF